MAAWLARLSLVKPLTGCGDGEASCDGCDGLFCNHFDPADDEGPAGTGEPASLETEGQSGVRGSGFGGDVSSPPTDILFFACRRALPRAVATLSFATMSGSSLCLLMLSRCAWYSSFCVATSALCLSC